MGELLSKVIPLSLGAAISPTVLALALVILSGRRSIARGSAYLAGVLTVLTGLTALGLIGVHQSTKSASADEITRIVDGIAGTLLLLLALGSVLRAFTTDPAVPAEDEQPDPEKGSGLVSAYLVGVTMMVINFSTILLYLPAMHEISASSVSASDQAVAVMIAFLITSLPATLPFAFRVAVPNLAARVFGRLHAFISRHQRQIGVVIEVVFGVYLVIKAIR